ncbi:S1C family serine protease [Sporomusa sphaeroides]|uniref:Serine protease HtrA n=2 Tax=Sporomusa TaxID=2375 RepID=A0ABM9W8N9_9FIRM|nr:trypsin-like peptidase domain-containing protein [Sporomusa sphaeroides]OLS54415.1 putative serine protease HtrA [Sporomusa sphaeroides DSM 2875]CVK20658.1 Putative serine protease HtrA [Sporomusa sphaeroides DSM 2875]SCM82843.1 Serine protease Do-like HtrB [uncultured Sporomusa sp.]
MNWYKRLTPYIAVSLISMIIGATLMVGCAGGISGNKAQKPNTAESPFTALQPPTAQAQVSEARNTPIVRAAQTVGPAVVGITNKGIARDFFSNRKVMVEQGSGSGVIFDAQGYIATNYHVVANAQEISVSLADGRTMDGKVIGVDAATDLAVVKVDAQNLPVAILGDSDALMVGEPAIAIGNPLGLEFKGSVTAGVISALNRSLDIGERRFKLIQTDAAINPGNSGGALVNADGVVIGINSAKIALSGVEGIGFAIPINSARPILQSLIDKGRVIRAYLGVGALDPTTAAKYGYELKLEKGVYIVKVSLNGPAAKAGIREKDIILKVAGAETNSVAELRAILDTHQVGSSVEVVILRNDKKQTINVLLEEMSEQ